MNPQNIAVIGASGALGQAFVHELRNQYPDAEIHPFSQQQDHYIDYHVDSSIAAAAAYAASNSPLDWVIVTNGLLHAQGLNCLLYTSDAADE